MKLFEPIPGVVAVRVVRDRATQRCRGLGFLVGRADLTGRGAPLLSVCTARLRALLPQLVAVLLHVAEWLETQPEPSERSAGPLERSSRSAAALT